MSAPYRTAFDHLALLQSLIRLSFVLFSFGHGQFAFCWIKRQVGLGPRIRCLKLLVFSLSR